MPQLDLKLLTHASLARARAFVHGDDPLFGPTPRVFGALGHSSPPVGHKWRDHQATPADPIGLRAAIVHRPLAPLAELLLSITNVCTKLAPRIAGYVPIQTAGLRQEVRSLRGMRSPTRRRP